jgi:hypothetical protein
VTTEKRAFFTFNHAETLFQGRAPEEADFDLVAAKLTLIAEGCVSVYQRATGPTAGKRQEWFRSVAGVSSKLLALFGLHRPLDHLEGPRTLDAINALQLSVPTQLDLYLRQRLAKEIKASEVPSVWQTFRMGLGCMQLMMHYAQLADDAAEKSKSSSRRAPEEELYLVRELYALNVEITEDKRWYTVVDGTPQGPMVELVGAVATHIHDHLDVMEPAPPPGLAAHLNALSKSPRRIAKRLSMVRPLFEGTNRS